MSREDYPVTPDGRYFVVRGRLWRRSDPSLSEEDRRVAVAALMRARRAVRTALVEHDTAALKTARADVQAAKETLGERGIPWWTDGTPDFNRHMAKNSPYAGWYAGLDAVNNT